MDNQSDLPPIDLKEDIEQYQALSESKEINFPRCDHKDIEFVKELHLLKCVCGVAYSGERLSELYETLTKRGN